MGATSESAEGARVTAQLEGFEGSWLVGWARSQADAKPCIISVRDQSGAQIAEGEASRHRSDLAALDLGHSDFGFRIQVPDLGTTEFVRVFANGMELRGSPLAVGQGHFDGRLYVENGFATGWVTERLQLFSPPQIDIVGPAGNIIASAPSQLDDSGGDPGFVPARFRISLAALLGRTEVLIRACAKGVPFARAGCNLRVVGHLDVATPEHWAGWVSLPDAPSADFAIEIRRDGELVATAPCTIARNDVKAAHPGSDPLGFDVRRVPLVENVSSSRIRELVRAGDVRRAATPLGRPPEVEGIVVRGDGRGRELGFPTANLDVPEGLLVPPDGVCPRFDKRLDFAFGRFGVLHHSLASLFPPLPLRRPECLSIHDFFSSCLILGTPWKMAAG